MTKRKVVLMYHDIVTADDKTSGFQNDSAFQYKINETDFEEQVKALKGKDVELTFDDGGISFYTKAAPILEKYGFRGVFFVSTDYIGTTGFLTFEQIKELDNRGHIIGSHSCSHPQDMTKLSEAQIKLEWKNSLEILKKTLGHPIEYASIPNGYLSKVIIECVNNTGIKYLYTSTPTTKIRKEQSFQMVGRYVIYKDMPTLKVVKITCSEKCRFMLFAKWFILSIIKLVLGNYYSRVKAKIIR